MIKIGLAEDLLVCYAAKDRYCVYNVESICDYNSRDPIFSAENLL